MSKFTQGPYEADEYGCLVWAENRQVLIAEIRGWGHLTGKGLGGLSLPDNEAYKIQKANTRLLAAAPEMYRILKSISEYCKDNDIDQDIECDIWEVLKRIDGEGESQDS